MKAPMHAAVPCVTINSRQATLGCKAIGGRVSGGKEG